MHVAVYHVAPTKLPCNRLRKLANAILHLDPEKDEGLPSMGEPQLEKEIVSLLCVLRALIEGVN